MVNVDFVHNFTTETVPESEKTLSMQREISNAISEVLNYLKDEGIEFDEDLKIKHIQRKCFIDATLTARANILRLKETEITYQVELQKRHFQEAFGLTMSEEALIELKELMEKEWERIEREFTEKFPEELNDEVDIFIYGTELPYFEELKSILLHEIWHLIEDKKNVFVIPELIHEGTATYVQERFLGVSYDETLHKTNSAFYPLYDLGAKIVHEELGDDGPAKLLDPDFRKKLVHRFNSEVLPLFFKMTRTSTTDFERQQFLEDKDFADFRQNPTKENLLRVWHKKKLHKMANDFEKQDMSTYIEYLKNLVN